MLSVGLIGSRGFMGSAFLPALTQASHQGKLRLVLLHRPGSDTSSFPENVEKRMIDLAKGDVEDIARSVEGLNVVISAITGRNGGHQLQIPLIDALASSKDLLIFFPSEYATPFRQEDLDRSEFLRRMTCGKAAIIAHAKERKVPVTILKNATVPFLLFSWDGAKFRPKENSLKLYSPRGDGTRGLTSKDFSGAALVHLLLDRPETLPNATISLVEHSFSSQLLVDTFTKIHGRRPDIIETTEEDYQRGIKEDGFGSMGAASDKSLSVGVDWPGETIDSESLSRTGRWDTKSFEDYVRESLDN
ncbi:hypothetical protein BD324DRAFT_635114 [Kockovaella imperatae]|uniref:NmrA-like domain-containing protein n=1 Tax=Kockovaella imperatae TaxID=4999 RepID=A0A1Y1U9V7_9TREE|nr:hypothetical protein BD324DRAFT_635114 [Kockovaella imperatae]ORX34813.1 hypothetical protein BD324DRAFT_635114 [Kockovaella imperatae]